MEIYGSERGLTPKTNKRIRLNKSARKIPTGVSENIRGDDYSPRVTRNVGVIVGGTRRRNTAHLPAITIINLAPSNKISSITKRFKIICDIVVGLLLVHLTFFFILGRRK
jgi:hypothetical protein